MGESSPKLSSPRRGWSLIELLLAFSVLLVIAGLAWYGYETSRRHAVVRLCHEQQRRLQRSIDGLGVTDLDTDVDVLVARAARELGGESTVVDPGFPPGTPSHYVVMAGSLKLGCTVHGSPFLGGEEAAGK